MFMRISIKQLLILLTGVGLLTTACTNSQPTADNSPAIDPSPKTEVPQQSNGHAPVPQAGRTSGGIWTVPPGVFSWPGSKRVPI